MINLKGEIVFNTTDEQITARAPSDFKKNNISAVLNNTIDNEKSENLFILGFSKLNGTSTLTQYEGNYFYSQKFSSASGNLASTFTITITANNCDLVFIEFNTENNLHPKQLIADGVTYKDIKSFTCVLLDKSLSTHEISFKTWTPNAPVIIKGIYTNYNIKHLYSVDIPHLDRSDENSISWGVKNNAGSLTFNDDNNVLSVADQHNLIVGKRVRTFLKSKNNTQQLSNFYISSFEKTSEIECKIFYNDLLHIQKIKFPIIWMQDSMSLYDFLVVALQKSENIAIIVTPEALEKLQQIKLRQPFFADNNTYWWGFLDQISQIGGFYISASVDGEVFIQCSGGA